MASDNDEALAAEAIERKAYEQAVRLLLPLAERNSEYALLSLGWIYETGAIGAPDKDAARKYYELAASAGSVSVYSRLGWLLLEQGEEENARAAFNTGAQRGDEECMSLLTRLDDSRNEQLAMEAIESESFEEAVRLLVPLAERNSEYALLSLGWIYETGATGVPDKRAAREYYELAAAQGSASGYFELGRLLAGEDQEALARSAFDAGAQRGDVPSMARLGRMMVEGRGGPTALEEGVAWLSKAATQGHILAKRTLLSLEAREAKTLLGKFSAKIKIATLAKEGLDEMLKDSQSDKMR